MINVPQNKPAPSFYQVIIMVSTKSRIKSIPAYFKVFRNMALARVNFTDLVAGTSASELWTNGTITKTGYVLENMSDVLRIIVLLSFGGVYFDSDVISVKEVSR